MKKIIYLYSLVILLLTLSACNTTSTALNRSANTFFSSSEADNSCEIKVRDQIEQKKILFLSELTFQKDIDLANHLINTSTSSEIYSFDEINGQIQEIKKTLKFNINELNTEISFTIGLNDKNSSQPMYFEVKSEQRSKAEKTELSQRYSVNTKCDLNLKNTSKTHLTLINTNTIQYKSKTIADSEVIDDSTKTYLIPDGKNSIDFLSITTAKDMFETLDSVQSPVILIPTIGFVDVEILSLSNSTESGFGKVFNFERRQMTISMNKKTLVSIIAQIDSANNVQLSTYLDQNKKSWTLPKEFKDQISLGQAQLGNSYFDSKLTNSYQSASSSYILKTNKDFTYNNISGYYQATFIENKDDFKTYKMQETSPPIFNDKVTPMDLEVNSTIQSDLPEIQKIAQDILIKSSNRTEQISEILKYLSLNYTYDYDMLEKDKVRPLTTKEALDRKKGVCQHYAVLFTAIARSLKIPSRIVVGYYINAEKPGMHAWVEAEVKENQWQVIEPQSVNGLTQTYTRFYFPLIRGFFLEDKTATTMIDYITTLMNLKLIATPIQ